MENATFYTHVLEDNNNIRFVIPVSNEELCDELTSIRVNKKIIQFQADYIALSQKYRMAELISQEALEYANIDVEKLYAETQTKQYETGYFSILPEIWDLEFKGVPYNLFAASKIYLHRSNEVIYDYDIIHEVTGEEVIEMFNEE